MIWKDLAWPLTLVGGAIVLRLVIKAAGPSGGVFDITLLDVLGIVTLGVGLTLLARASRRSSPPPPPPPERRDLEI